MKTHASNNHIDDLMRQLEINLNSRILQPSDIAPEYYANPNEKVVYFSRESKNVKKKLIITMIPLYIK